jgi:hypothetical protein
MRSAITRANGINEIKLWSAYRLFWAIVGGRRDDAPGRLPRSNARLVVGNAGARPDLSPAKRGGLNIVIVIVPSFLAIILF